MPRLRAGFTLIELLVCILVIAALLSLALPALGRTRNRAQATKCAASVHQACIFVAAFAEQYNKGGYPNALEPGAPFAEWTLGTTFTVTSQTLEQTRMWLGPLAARGYVTEQLEGERFACPTAQRQLPRDSIDSNPQILSQWSFWYSASLYTRSEMWDPAFPARRQAPDDWRKTVGAHEVLFPSSKVMLFEVADWHGTGRRLELLSPGQGRVNVACCDGHGTQVDPYGGQPGLDAPWPNYPGGAIHFSGAMPFSSPAMGYAGRDW